MIEFDKRAMTEVEDEYTFTQSSQISGQCGLIGHLRADMDSDGNGFFPSWFDYREDLETQEFKDEFDSVIDSLREDGDIFYNRRDLANYCYFTPQSRMKTEENYFGIRIDTEKYAYLFRLNPNKGEYNIYCYCYIKDWLNDHIHSAEKGIRFIDPNYNELFRIKDGGTVIVDYRNGERKNVKCKYIDDYHLEFNNNIFHICELAERMQENGNTITPDSNSVIQKNKNKDRGDIR